MKEAKQIAAELSRGNIKTAYGIRERLLSNEGDLYELEVTEIAKQAMLAHLKNGKIDFAIQIKNLFDVSESLYEDTVQQAVLSSFCDGDVARVKELTDELPIPKDLRKKIVEYCATWGKKDMTTLMEAVFA